MAKKAKKTKKQEPYWAPLPRQSFSKAQTIGIVVRNLIPVACILVFGGSALEFLLLSVFNLSLTIACIAVVGVGVSTEIENANAGKLNAVGSWITLVLIGLFISLLLTGMFG